MKASTLYYIALLLFGVKMFSQTDQSIKTDLPQIAPPSPTVAALMKFEEVPVNNYTGIPDISIPLYGIQTHSKDIGINLSLKYHPGSIAVDEEAGYTGLGWSLIGGGTISRTVRGYADDMIDGGNNHYGIYVYAGSYPNPFYDVTAINGTPTTTQEYNRQKLYWETLEKGRFDTQHDLYQFNFMGHSGRFYIKKSGSVPNASYEVIKLDNDNSVKINYSGTEKTFNIYDESGYKYIFDIKEITTETSISENFYFDNSSNTSSTINPSYISAFHLSKIYDNNDRLLVEYKYNIDNIDEPIIETSSNVTTTRNSIVGVLPTLGICGDYVDFDPKVTTHRSNRITYTKKIKQISVEDKALVNFILSDGSEDPNGPQIHRLKHITVHPWSDPTAVVKQFELFYDYSEVNYGSTPRKRLILNKVSEIEPYPGTKTQSYELFYAEGSAIFPYGRDYWGYFNSWPSNTITFDNKAATPGVCEIDVLQKMRLPSGGAIVFDYEANTYSFIGSTELTDFSSNPNNFTNTSETYPGHHLVSPPNNYSSYFNSTSNYTDSYTIPPSSDIRHVSFKGNIISGNPGTFKVVEVVSSPPFEIEVLDFSCGSGGANCVQTPEIIFAPNKTYKIKYSVLMSSGVGLAEATAYYRTEAATQLQYLYGGGIRIKNIGYFEDGNVPKNIFDFPNGNYIPSKQKKYDYSSFENTQKSSGSLAFPKPVFAYELDKQYYIMCPPNEGYYDIRFRTVTDTDNVKQTKTQGSDVGYQNVTVWETGNGFSRYEYTSPINNPEESYSVGYPFLPSKNFDFRRGILKSEKHYREDSKLLKETIFSHLIQEGNERTGIIVSTLDNCEFAYLYSDYDDYLPTLQQCTDSHLECRVCGLPISYIHPYMVDEYFGWVKLTEKNTKEYFYTSTNTAQGTVETKETYTYNSLNKKIASVTTETYNGGSTPETVSQEFTYLYDTALLPINKIGEIEKVVTKKDGNITGTQKILYAGTYPGNAASLPQTIQASKGDLTLENRVQFVKYDSWSNPLEVKLENGTPVSYIWGYNKTQPIAMIENATYEELATALGTTVANIRDNYSEANLNAINNLRNTLQTAMITTYTYIPLVGVATVTDPKGMVTTYEYDGMGRLKAVKDQDGNLLSENEYHYRMP